MGKIKAKKNESISEKISKLYTVAPRADVEDDLVYNTKPTTVSRDDIDSDLDDGEAAALSTFRKQNAALLSDVNVKYAGKVGSKKLSDEESDSSEDENNSIMEASDAAEDSHEDKEEAGSDSPNDDDDNIEGSDEGDDDEEDEELESEEGFDLSQLNESKEDGFVHIKEADVAEEANKGKCVKNQLTIWENLLEMRIGLQKCLVSANRMPLTENYIEMKKADETFLKSANKAKSNVKNLLDKFIDLQTLLWSQFPETKDVMNNDKKTEPATADIDPDDEEIPSDFESPDDDDEKKKEKPTALKKRKLNDVDSCLSERHASFVKYRNNVIQKWHDKTKITVVNSKNKNPPISTLSQIDFLLNDRQRLVRRTQIKRSRYDIIGQNAPDTREEDNDAKKGNDDDYCTEIFDDDDFYHQLLRELIEHKSADVTDPIQLSRQWITLQQMRSKMKRKIDTKATKGRRIRYAVHSKMVNFMAPQRNYEWTDDGKNELFASLFGKQFASESK